MNSLEFIKLFSLKERELPNADIGTFGKIRVVGKGGALTESSSKQQNITSTDVGSIDNLVEKRYKDRTARAAKWERIDWCDLLPRLQLVAERLLARSGTRREARSISIRGRTSEDFVYDAVVKTILGRRPWRGKTTLFRHLTGAIRSEISNSFQAAERPVLDQVVDVADSRAGPAEQLADEQEIAGFLNLLVDESVRKVAVLMIFEGMTKPSEIAASMNISVSDANNIKRRLKRALQKYLSQAPE